jgi:hypothetical protein
MRLCLISIAAATLIGFSGSTSRMLTALPSPTNETQRSELFKWMDSVGIPSANGCQFFEITVSMPKTCGDRKIILHAFKICELQGKCVYFTDDACDLILEGNQRDGTHCRQIDFKAYVESVLAVPTPYLDSYSNGYCIEMGHRCSLGRSSLNLLPAMRDIMLAKWCAQTGHHDAVDQLWARASKTMPALTEGKSVDELFKTYLPAFLLDRAVASMANPATRRVDCIARLDWIKSTWNGSEYGDLAGQLSDDLRVALRMERDLDSELNGIVKSPESADQLVRKLIDQEFWGADARTGFGPFEGTGGISAFSEVLKQSSRTRNVLSKYVDSDAPTRLVYHYPNKLPRMRWVTLGAVAQGLLDRIDTESGANK